MLRSLSEKVIPVAPQKFFDERSDQSETKARIIQKYFYAWAKVISPSAKTMDGRIAYIDLYAGPGRYRDGAASTPLLVLEHAINDPTLRDMLVALFNDVDENHTSTLQTEIDNLAGIEKLKHKPQVNCNEIGEDTEKFFSESRLIPSFTFVDPFGYKGLSLKIVNGVIKDWGCDCVFFFNYGRINAGITNPKVETHMDALFGAERAEKPWKIAVSSMPSNWLKRRDFDAVTAFMAAFPVRTAPGGDRHPMQQSSRAHPGKT
jgi:three-Cys-motif partner protein